MKVQIKKLDKLGSEYENLFLISLINNNIVLKSLVKKYKNDDEIFTATWEILGEYIIKKKIEIFDQITKQIDVDIYIEDKKCN